MATKVPPAWLGARLATLNHFGWYFSLGKYYEHFVTHLLKASELDLNYK